MGVTGLWQILDSVGHPIKVEALEGKRLGVDANIWLYKFIRGFREKDNSTSIEAHKLGLFNRISKLLFYKIKPVFVFDGPAPVLKRRTLERRQNIRNKELTKAQNAAMKLIAEQLKTQYPNANLEELTIQLPELRSHNLVAAEKLTDEDNELFYLPPERIQIESDSDECDNDLVSEHLSSLETSIKREKSNDEEAKIYHIDSDDELPVESNFNTGVDIESKEFSCLPAEIRYELLMDVRDEKRRIKRAAEMPEEAESFSNFQLNRLKAKRAVQEKIEQCERDICLAYTGELAGSKIQSYRVQSDSTSTMLFGRKKEDGEEGPFPKLNVQEHGKIKTDSPKQEPVQEVGESPYSNMRKLPKKDGSQKIQLNFYKSTKPFADPKLFQANETVCLSESDEEPTSKKESSSSTEIESDGFSPVEEPNEALNVEETVKQVSNLHNEVESHDNSHSEDPKLEGILDEKIITPNKTQSETINLDSTATETESDIEEEAPEAPKLNPKSTVHEVSDLNLEKESIPINETVDIIDSDEELPVKDSLESKKKEPCTEVEVSDSNKVQAESSEKEPPPKIVESSNQNQNQIKNTAVVDSRAARKVTTRVIEEAKELLRLFGVPYIDAAGEAEAQCALLEELKLTEGTITDDSDVWLFGSKNVYRHFFSDDKYVLQYKMSEIEFHIRMSRENLVCFAMLVGSDYTDGILNVGPVTALEILSEFPGDKLEPLLKFKNWRDKYESKKERVPGSKKRESFLKFKLPEDFPSRIVFEGYMKPMADFSTEKFTWGTPELDELREYARRNFGWDPKKIDDKLLPLMKRINERKTQPTIDSFFFKRAAEQNPELFRSKRINQALSKIATTSSQEVVLTDEDDDDEADDMVETKPKGRGRKGVVPKTSKTVQNKGKSPKRAVKKSSSNETSKRRKLKTKD